MSESNFIQKVGAACNKKEDLYQKSKTRYAVRSIFAGGFLTLSTAVGAVAADLLNSFVPGTGRFLFPFIFLGLGLPLILKCGINHLKYDVFDGGDLSKENSLEESGGNSSLLYLF